MSYRTVTAPLVATVFLGFSAIAAGPTPDGTTVKMRGGVGTYEYISGGCGSTQALNRANHVDVHVGATTKIPVGLTVSADVNGTYDKNVSSEFTDGSGVNTDELGRETYLLSSSLRIGFEWDYVGFDVGGFFLLHDDGLLPFPAGSLWVGLPKLHGYAELFANDITVTDGGLARLGIGHQQENYRARFAFMPSAGDDLQLEVALGFNVDDVLWAGFTAHGDTAGGFGGLQISKTF